MAHQVWFDPIPSYPEDMPEAFREWCDPERPEWLDLTIARFLKIGLTELFDALKSDSVPNATWAKPWIQIQMPLPWKRKPLSEALTDDIQQLMIEQPAGPFDALGGTFTTLTRIRTLEYLTRFAGIVIPLPSKGIVKPSALVLDRVLEQEFLIAISEKKATQEPFLRQLLAFYSIGMEDEESVEPLLPDKRSDLHAKELNRIREAFRPHMGRAGASMALVFPPTAVMPEKELSIPVFWFGLNLSESIQRKAESTKGRALEKALHKQVDKLIGWTSKILPGAMVNRFRSVAISDETENLPLSIPEDMAPKLRDALGIDAIERKLDGLSHTLERGGWNTFQATGLALRGRPGRHDEGKAEYRKFLESRERDLRFNRMFRVFREEWPWAQSQPSAELDLLRQTIERNKLHKKYWNEIADIRKQKASRKSSRKRSRGKR